MNASDLSLETARLILRPLEERDIDALWGYRADPEVARYQGWRMPYTREDAAELVAEMLARQPGEPGHWCQVGLERKTDQALLGDVAFKITPDRAQAEIGFTLAQANQGQGYAREAVSRLLDYLFAQRGVRRVYANCDPDNLASKRLMETLGMRMEGRFIESYYYRGAWVSEDWYAILRREWLTGK